MFRDKVARLLGKVVRLGRRGPDANTGTIARVHDDYLTLVTEEGTLVHYQLRHLKSVSEVVNSAVSKRQLPMGVINALPATFSRLIASMFGHKIQVYDHGPETTTGLVFGQGDDFLVISTSPDELVHFPLFHVRSVRLAKSKEQQTEAEEREKSMMAAAQGGVEAAEAEVVAAAKSPKGTSPGKSPKGKSPKGKSPKGKSPKGKSPKGKSPKGKSPKDKSPKGKSPNGKSPKGKSPKGKSPKGKSPKGKSPKGKSPKGKSPKGKSPKGKSPKGKSPRGKSHSGKS